MFGQDDNVFPVLNKFYIMLRMSQSVFDKHESNLVYCNII